MRKIPVLFPALCSLLLMVASLASADIRPEPRTLFDFAERSWAVGVIQLGAPLTFREGAVLAFPSQIVDLVWAPNNTQPRNLMLVYELKGPEKNNPPFKERDQILAPIRLLPEHSYWKDNLPNTRRHEIAGGGRYAFRGNDIPAVRKVLADYLEAFGKHGHDRWTGEIRAVASGLNSGVSVVREDAAIFLSNYPTLQRDFDEAAVPDIGKYLASDAPVEEKASVVDALASAGLTMVKPALESVAGRNDATGAVALRGLDKLGAQTPTARLLELSRSSSPEMQAYAAEALSRRAATDDAAMSRASEMLTDKANPLVLDALGAGFGQAGGDRVTSMLGQALARGDSTSKPAGKALAAIGSPAAQEILTKTVKEKSGEAAFAAVGGLSEMGSCADCRQTLAWAFEKHPDERVRQLAGVVLEVPLQHKH